MYGVEAAVSVGGPRRPLSRTRPGLLYGRPCTLYERCAFPHLPLPVRLARARRIPTGVTRSRPRPILFVSRRTASAAASPVRVRTVYNVWYNMYVCIIRIVHTRYERGDAYVYVICTRVHFEGKKAGFFLAREEQRNTPLPRPVAQKRPTTCV